MAKTALGIVRRFYPDVTAVKDAKRTLRIEVTPSDCESKAVKNHKECALAQACKRRKSVDGVIIAVKTGYIIKGQTATRFYLGESITREIVSFDRTGRFNPGIYELKKPSNKLGDPRSSGSNKRSGLNGKKKRHYHLTANVRQIFA